MWQLITVWKVFIFGVFLVHIFPHLGIIQRYSISLCFQFKCGKIRTRKSPKTDTSHAVDVTKKTDKLTHKLHTCDIAIKLVITKPMLYKLRNFVTASSFESVYSALFESKLKYTNTTLGHNIKPIHHFTAQKIKFSITDFFIKCDQIHRKL